MLVCIAVLFVLVCIYCSIVCCMYFAILFVTCFITCTAMQLNLFHFTSVLCVEGSECTLCGGFGVYFVWRVRSVLCVEGLEYSGNSNNKLS